MLLLPVSLQLLAAPPGTDPFAFFRPSVTVSIDDRRLLDRGEPVARVLPAEDREVAVFAAVRVAISGDRLVAWMRRIAELKKSAYVLAIGRFSDQPAIEDLSGLALDDGELSEVVDCRPGSCGLKLSATEITQLQHVAASGGDWKPAVQQAFRQVMLQRVKVYLAGGHGGMQSERSDRPTSGATSFASVLDHSPFLTQHLSRFAERLRRYPQAPIPEVESFVYWSKERIAGKAIISATHVSIVRNSDNSLPEVLVAGDEFFATHYINASLGLTALMRGDAGAHYLVYVNRSAIDMPGGVFGGLIRWVMQRRLRDEAASALQGLRRRLESGEPAPIGSTGPSGVLPFIRAPGELRATRPD